VGVRALEGGCWGVRVQLVWRGGRLRGRKGNAGRDCVQCGAGCSCKTAGEAASAPRASAVPRGCWGWRGSSDLGGGTRRRVGVRRAPEHALSACCIGHTTQQKPHPVHMTGKPPTRRVLGARRVHRAHHHRVDGPKHVVDRPHDLLVHAWRLGGVGWEASIGRRRLGIGWVLMG
jgi:hypothetical protein